MTDLTTKEKIGWWLRGFLAGLTGYRTPRLREMEAVMGRIDRCSLCHVRWTTRELCRKCRKGMKRWNRELSRKN